MLEFPGRPSCGFAAMHYRLHYKQGEGAVKNFFAMHKNKDEFYYLLIFKTILFLIMLFGKKNAPCLSRCNKQGALPGREVRRS